MLEMISTVTGLVFAFLFLLIIIMFVILATFLLGHVLPMLVIMLYEYIKTRKTRKLVKNRRTKL